MLRLARWLSAAMALSRQTLAGILMMVVTLVFSFPFGTHALPLLVATGVMATAVLFAGVATWIVSIPILAIGISRPAMARALPWTVAALACLLVTGAILAADRLWAAGLMLNPVEVLIRVSIVVFAVAWLGQNLTSYPISRLLQRNLPRQALNAHIDKDKQGDLISISAQDHYVEITTTAGKELVRMRMQDAIAAVEKDSGITIHRSHWIALTAISAVNESKREVDLIDGRTLPVAPARLPDLVLALSTTKDGGSPTDDAAMATPPSRILAKLQSDYIDLRKQLDVLFLDAYRGKAIDTKLALKITRLLQQVGLVSPVQLVQLAIVMLAPAAFGSYGTFDLPVLSSILYWIAILFVCAPFVLSSHFMVYYFGLKSRVRSSVVAFFLFATETTISSALLFLTLVVLFGGGLAEYYQFFFGISLSNSVLHLYAQTELHRYRSISSWEDGVNYPPIVLSLPFEERGDLIAIGAKGRQVEVRTTTGVGHLKLRFSDAMAQTGKVPGLQVHRSHWVAKDWVYGRRVNRASTYVELKDGTLIPLSNAKIAELDAALNGPGA